MKFAFALLAAVSADPAANGTPCTDNASCKPADPADTCCVVGTGGAVCKDAKCAATVDGKTAPNTTFCQMTDDTKAAATQIVTVDNSDGTTQSWFQYTKPSGGWTCMSGAQTLAAAGVAVLSVANMM